MGPPRKALMASVNVGAAPLKQATLFPRNEAKNEQEPIYVSHPLLKSDTIEHRDYQDNIFVSVLGEDALVVLPTGLGKTILAAMLVSLFRIICNEIQIFCNEF